MLAPTNADGDSGKQITDVRNLIGAGAKGLIVVANDSKAIIPALDYRRRRRKCRSSPSTSDRTAAALYAIVRADNRRHGLDRLRGHGQGDRRRGQGAVAAGRVQTSINGRERSEGFHDCMTKEHPNIELIERPTDWDATKQAAALQTVLAANPDLKGIFQQSDYALSPTLNVLKQAGRDAKVGEPGHIYNISIDAEPAGARADPQRRPRRRYLAAARPLREVRRPVPARCPRRQGADSSARPTTAARSSSSTATRWIFCRRCWSPRRMSTMRRSGETRRSSAFQPRRQLRFRCDGSSARHGVEPLVEARAVSKRYGKTLALDDVSMKVFAGQSVALAGRNGAGKSTMVRLLTGPRPPGFRRGAFRRPAGAGRLRTCAMAVQGRLRLPEVDDHPRAYRRREPVPERSARLALRDRSTGAKLRRLGRKELDAWGLDVDVDQRAGELTVGQKQLLEIARALRQGTRFIILDEPTARLESREIRQLFDHITRLKKAGVTFLFISHHLQEIYEICERVAVMRDGRLVAEAAVGRSRPGELVAAMVGESYVSHPGRRRRTAARAAGAAARRATRMLVRSCSTSTPFRSATGARRLDAGSRRRAGRSRRARGIRQVRSRPGDRRVSLSPSSGRISVNGAALRLGRVDAAREIGIAHVPDDRHASGFCSNLSVEENIALPVLHRLSRGWGFISRDTAPRAREHDDRQAADQGQRRRAEHQRAFRRKPAEDRDGPRAGFRSEVLVLGHPTAGVDIASKQALFDIIRDTRLGGASGLRRDRTNWRSATGSW